MKTTVNHTVITTTTKVYTAGIHHLGFGLSFSVGPTGVAATIIKQTLLKCIKIQSKRLSRIDIGKGL